MLKRPPTASQGLPPSEEAASQRTTCPSCTWSTCVAHGSSPSKTCVTVTMVLPSFFRKSRSLWRTSRSKSVVASSRSSTAQGSLSLRPSSTRRRSPSEMLPMYLRSSLPSPSISRRPAVRASFASVGTSDGAASLEAGSSSPSICHTRMKSVLSPTPSPAARKTPWTRATLRPEDPRKGSTPITLTQPAGAIFFPERSSSSVDFPAPFAPTTTQRAPAGSSKDTFFSNSGPPGNMEKVSLST
mmetsp:Transcript_68738/g.201266  ORF Transcript_68738/g.201266 Transcript_68738/m.201266 type:complete len:242 (-) Transcript_68738:93-818(-)